MTGETKKTESSSETFETGNTKIYVSTETIRYCSMRKIIQIGALNARTEELVHYISHPGLLKKYCSNALFNYLKYRNLETGTPWYLKEKKQKQGLVKDVLQHFLGFLKKEADANNKITLVFYCASEYHELMMVAREDPAVDLVQQLVSLVDSVVVYELYKNKVSDRIKDLSPLDSLLDVKVIVYSCDKLAELLRTLFVESDKMEDKYHPFKPDPDKVPKIKVSYPRSSFCSQPKYLLLSSTRVNYSGRDWKEDSEPIPREEYRYIPSYLEDQTDTCVTAFRTGLFRMNQPVIVKFRDLQEDTKSISYTGNLLNCYLASGSCPLYTFNSVTFAIVNFSYQNNFKDCTELNDSDYVQYKGYLDTEIDIFARTLEPDQSVLKITEKQDIDISVKEEKVAMDLVIADIDRKNSAAIRKGMLKSLLVKLTPSATAAQQDVSLSASSAFIVTSISNQFKDLKIVNQIFCLAKDETQLVRLVLTCDSSATEDLTLHTGDTVGQAVHVDQSNFGEALVQAFQHELDLTRLVLDPIKKRRIEEEEEASEKLRERERRRNSQQKQQNKKRKRREDQEQDLYYKQQGSGYTDMEDLGMRREDLGMRREDLGMRRGDMDLKYSGYQDIDVRYDQQDTRGGSWQQEGYSGSGSQGQDYHHQQYMEFLQDIGERR